MMRMKSYGIALGAAVLLTLLLSCGGVKQINLAYTSGNLAPLPKANTGQEVVINKFKDSRSQKHIGEATNHGGTVFFTVEAKNDISSWVTNAVAAELGKSGFSVAVGENAVNPEKFIINGNLSRVFASGIISEMRVTIQVIKDYKIILNKSYTTAGSKVGRVTAPIVYWIDYVKLFDITLQDLMIEMIPQIITAITQNASQG